MRPARMWYALLMLALIFPPGIVADDSPRYLSDRQLDLIEKNMIHNFNTCCTHLLVSCTQTMLQLKSTYPQYDFDYAILPLMAKLKNDDCCEVRIMAALALNQFDSEKARFAIARRAIYDSSERVRKVCTAIVRSWNAVPDVPNRLNASL